LLPQVRDKNNDDDNNNNNKVKGKVVPVLNE
jgi:hypothetical protein